MRNVTILITSKLKPLMIIPAAGSGQGLGAGQSLMQNALDQAKRYELPVHLITGKEKRPLIEFVQDYCHRKNITLSVQLIESSREWPHTILQSQKYWQELNIVCLPDTVFEPVSILQEMTISLNHGYDCAFAVFKPKDFQSWSVVISNSETEIQICEKPPQIPESLREHMRAWGLYGFKKSIGVGLLEAQLVSTFDHNWVQLKYRASLLELTHFEDLTRRSSGSSRN